MKNNYNILYIDDVIDMYISKFLGTNYRENSKEYTFKENDTYETILKLINDNNINILIIDSQLFTNNNAGNKFTGEAFMMLLKKFNPYVEVIIITQNDTYAEIGAISKYRPGYEQTETQYFEQVIEVVEKTKEKLKLYHELSETLELNPGLKKYTVEKIRDAVNGITDYDDLTKDDIDRLIKSFNLIRKGC